MSIAAGLREAWAIVSSKETRAGLRALHFDASNDRVWATVNENGLRGLLITVAPDESISVTVAAIRRASSALAAELYSFVEEGKPQRGLHLWCTRPDLLEAFVGFCEPFISRIHRGERVDEAFAICFEEFKRLVAGLDDLQVSSTVIGLLGELKVLSDLLELNASADNFWSYPILERHDFRNGSAALEVKTSLRSMIGKPVVAISALDQLDPPSGGSLHLHWLRLERDPAGTISVVALLDQTSKYLPAERMDGLRARVLSDQVKSQHLQTFSLQERRSFRVDVEFPKLTPSRLITGQLDAGISNVTYDLDLSTATAFSCSPDEANRAFLSGGRNT